jgi:8-oxo-dGTP pyrophosphatase MutT (NUDIX family)
MESRSGANRSQREIDALAERLGEPAREVVSIHRMNRSRGPAGFPISSRRTAEVVLVIPRPGAKVLVHTKKFYPNGVWRLPTGGLHPGEAIESALLREGREETGLLLTPIRFLFDLRYEWEGSDKSFQSFGFLTALTHGEIKSNDPHEQITAFHDFDRAGLASVVERLETLASTWTAWGKFRAAAHRVVLGMWPPGGPLDQARPPGGDPTSPS